MSDFHSDPDRIPVFVQALRTPVGKYGGVLKDVRADDLMAHIIRELVRRTGLDGGKIDEVIVGCANQAGEDNRNVARMAALLAGLPHSVPAYTVNRLCASSLTAIIQAAYQIRAGEADVILAGGVESMSRAPYVLPKNVSGAASFGNLIAYDTALGWRFPNPRMQQMFPLESMGETAENLAERFEISREDQDAFALESHRKACRAQADGLFADEVVPVEIPGRKQASIVSADEQPRNDSTREKLAALKPAFRAGGSVTAGNSSSLNDGAAGVIVMSAAAARTHRLSVLARIVSSGTVGVDPRFMGIGPVPATNLALARAALSLEDMDVIELNEAFASQSLAVIRELGIDPSRLNPNGGAIALGHPLGCSGARITTSLLHELRTMNGRYGLATMCVGVGQGVALIIERVS